MRSRYSHATCVNFGGDTPTAELEVEFSYSVAWGAPESGRYGPPEDYDPGAGDGVEGLKVEKVDGKASGWSHTISDAQVAAIIIDRIETDDAALERMIIEAIEIEAADEQDAIERRFEDMREEMWADDQ